MGHQRRSLESYRREFREDWQREDLGREEERKVWKDLKKGIPLPSDVFEDTSGFETHYFRRKVTGELTEDELGELMRYRKLDSLRDLAASARVVRCVLVALLVVAALALFLLLVHAI